MELCEGDYKTLNGLMNGANGIFEDFAKTISKKLLWVYFHNLYIGHIMNYKFTNLWRIPKALTKKWTPIEHKLSKNN